MGINISKVKIPLCVKKVLFRALRIAGTYNPRIVLPYIRELLTTPEFNTLTDFLLWVYTTDKTFGQADIDQVFYKWLQYDNSLNN